MRFLLTLFIVVPIVEMLVLIKVGGLIGALPTVGLVLLTAVIGLALLKQQGISTLMRAQEKVDSGELPANEMVEGIFLAVGGALLLTPGFVTDFFGFCCLIPGVRQVLLKRAIVMFKPNVVFYSNQSARSRYEQGDQTPGAESGSTIEGDYRREDDK